MALPKIHLLMSILDKYVVTCYIFFTVLSVIKQCDSTQKYQQIHISVNIHLEGTRVLSYWWQITDVNSKKLTRLSGGSFQNPRWNFLAVDGGDTTVTLLSLVTLERSHAGSVRMWVEGRGTILHFLYGRNEEMEKRRRNQQTAQNTDIQCIILWELEVHYVRLMISVGLQCGLGKGVSSKSCRSDYI